MNLKKNIGRVDRLIRIALAFLILVLYYTDVIQGTTAMILGILSLVFMLTSYMRVCPLYMPFGISTITKKERGEN